MRDEIHFRCFLRRNDSSSIAIRGARDLQRAGMTFPTEREIVPDNRVLQRTDPREHFVDTDKWC